MVKEALQGTIKDLLDAVLVNEVQIPGLLEACEALCDTKVPQAPRLPEAKEGSASRDKGAALSKDPVAEEEPQGGAKKKAKTAKTNNAAAEEVKDEDPNLAATHGSYHGLLFQVGVDAADISMTFPSNLLNIKRWHSLLTDYTVFPHGRLYEMPSRLWTAISQRPAGTPEMPPLGLCPLYPGCSRSSLGQLSGNADWQQPVRLSPPLGKVTLNGTTVDPFIVMKTAARMTYIVTF